MKKHDKMIKVREFVEGKTAYYKEKLGWSRPQISAKDIADHLGVTKSTRLNLFLEEMVIEGYLDSVFYDNKECGYHYGYTVYMLPGELKDRW